jgi:hypothetical protein
MGDKLREPVPRDWLDIVVEEHEDLAVGRRRADVAKAA